MSRCIGYCYDYYAQKSWGGRTLRNFYSQRQIAFQIWPLRCSVSLLGKARGTVGLHNTQKHQAYTTYILVHTQIHLAAIHTDMHNSRNSLGQYIQSKLHGWWQTLFGLATIQLIPDLNANMHDTNWDVPGSGLSWVCRERVDRGFAATKASENSILSSPSPFPFLSRSFRE